jgi:hypothetical protein
LQLAIGFAKCNAKRAGKAVYTAIPSCYPAMSYGKSRRLGLPIALRWGCLTIGAASFVMLKAQMAGGVKKRFRRDLNEQQKGLYPH